MTDKKKVSIWLPKETVRRLRMEAASQDKRMNQIVQDALDLFFLGIDEGVCHVSE